MTARMREWSDGLGVYIGIAIVLVFFAILAFLLTVLARQDKLQWTGAKVAGSEVNGVVAYFWKGERYTIPVSGNATKPHVTMRVNQSDPTDAALDSAVIRAIDATMTLVPLAAAVGVLGLGAHRRRAQRHRLTQAAADPEQAYGTGLDSELVRRLLEERRRPPA